MSHRMAEFEMVPQGGSAKGLRKSLAADNVCTANLVCEDSKSRGDSASEDPTSIPTDDPEYIALRRLTLKKYGLTLEDYIARWHAQAGLCAICARPETAMRGGVLKMLAVDHDHATGRVRGLLCFRFNMALGFLDDNRERLSAAQAYLELHVGHSANSAAARQGNRVPVERHV